MISNTTIIADEASAVSVVALAAALPEIAAYAARGIHDSFRDVINTQHQLEIKTRKREK
jgi:hypothetical protein